MDNNFPQEPKPEDFDNVGDYQNALEDYKFFVEHGYWR